MFRLGHKIDRFLTARTACWRYAAKHGSEVPPPWMPPIEIAPGRLTGEGLFACLFVMSDAGIAPPQPLLAQDVTTRLVTLWQRSGHAPKSLPPVLPVPDDANSPVWLALLRVGPLRDAWETGLRRAMLKRLLALLPEAWVLDPTPLPPGAVIPRLELASWDEFLSLQSSGRRFTIVSARDGANPVILDAERSPETWKSAVTEALEGFRTDPCVLVEIAPFTDKSHPLTVAFYERKAGRVEWRGALASAADETGQFVPARLSPA
jgi:hypothetical protein